MEKDPAETPGDHTPTPPFSYGGQAVIEGVMMRGRRFTAVAVRRPEGDIVTKVDDDLITGSESLVATIRGKRPGDSVTITVLRGQDTQTVKATLDSDGGTATS